MNTIVVTIITNRNDELEMKQQSYKVCSKIQINGSYKVLIEITSNVDK
jgi:hypothetical protein